MTATVDLPVPLSGHVLRANFMDDVKLILRDAGFPVVGPGFPYAMHHTFYRSKIRIGGSRALHGDISKLLGLWIETRSDPADYAWQCVAGAIRFMAAKRPDLIPKIPLEVYQGIKSVGEGNDFLSFARNYARRSAIPPSQAPATSRPAR